jgi:hypothetical protein
MTRARRAASRGPSAVSPIAASPIPASPSAPANSSGAIAAVGPRRSAIPPTPQRVTAAVPVNASSPQKVKAELASRCGAKVKMAPPDAVMTTSAAIGPASARRNARRRATGPWPGSPSGARSAAPAARAIGQASGTASAGTAASTKTRLNPARSASQGAAGTRTN